MHKIRFTKVKADHDRIRDDVIEGIAHKLPKVGECFDFYSKSRNFRLGIRMVNTSPIVELHEDGLTYYLTTQSGSHYTVEVLAEGEDEATSHG